MSAALIFCLEQEELMKKFLFFFLVLILAAGFVAAQDLGLTAGLEFGIGNVNKANDDDMYPYLMPMVIYENAFLDGALDLYAELDYTFGFTKAINEDGKEVLPQSLYFDFMLGYNLSLGSASTLSFILENEFDEFIFSPRYKESNNLTGIFTPAVKFNQEFGFGDLYAKIGVPITYVQYYKDADAVIGLDFTAGWNSAFGLGIETIFYTQIAPSDGAGYLGLEAIVSYETGPLYFELDTCVPGKISEEGLTITPEVDYTFGNFTFYAFFEFAGMGIDGGKVSITPALGVKYSF